MSSVETFVVRTGSKRLLKRCFGGGKVRIKARGELHDSINETRAGPAEIGEGIDDMDTTALNCR